MREGFLRGDAEFQVSISDSVAREKGLSLVYEW